MQMKLSIKQKLALSISVINTLAVTVIVATFVFAFNAVSQQNTHKDLLLEAEEIVTEHITVEPDRIAYSLDGNDFSIEQDLLTDRLSAVIFSKEGNSLGSFGYFQIKQNLEKHVELFKLEVNNVCQTKQLLYKSDAIDKSQQLELLFYPIISNNECRGVLVIGASLESTLLLQRISLYLAVIMIAFVLLLNIVFGQHLAQILLRPLITIARKMHEVSVEQQVAPLPSLQTKDELNELTESFNAMVFRVQEGISKQKEFIANASHELKTPIARAMSDLDIATLHLKNNVQADAQLAIDNARSDLASLHAILESLLGAARIKHTGIQLKEINMQQIIQKELEQANNEIQLKKLRVTIDLQVETIKSDNRIWEIILRNCIQNAIKYNLDQGTMSISSTKAQSTTVISILNTMAPVHESVAVGERFARGDSTIKGSGIGLSIVKELCEVVGYKFSVSAKNGQFEVRITIL
jgi:signal transduction histidine kinase